MFVVNHCSLPTLCKYGINTQIIHDKTVVFLPGNFILCLSSIQARKHNKLMEGEIEFVCVIITINRRIRYSQPEIIVQINNCFESTYRKEETFFFVEI